MKKFLTALLCAAATLCLTLGLSACSGIENGNGGSGNGGEKDPTTAHTHTYDQNVTTEKYLKSAATCTQKAVYYFSCECGERGTQTFEYGELAAHTPVTDEAVAATCTTEGKTEGSHCSVCNEVIVAQTAVAKLAHTPATDAAIAATCTIEGKTEGSHCSVCNEVIVAQTAVAKLAHTPATDAAVAATCTTYGKTEGSHCSVCNEVIVAQNTIDKLAHTPVTDAAVTATCTTYGKTEGSHCSVCNTVIVAQQTIKKLAHNFENGACKICDTKQPSDLLYMLSDDKTYYYVAGLGKCTDTDIIIADMYGEDNLPVTSIVSGAFKNRTSFTSVTIPDGVTSIGSDAFYNCTALTSVSI